MNILVFHTEAYELAKKSDINQIYSFGYYLYFESKCRIADSYETPFCKEHLLSYKNINLLQVVGEYTHLLLCKMLG